jgi:diacylglycerol kinase
MEEVYNKPFIKSFKYAIEGLIYSIKFNRNFKTHLLAALIVIVASVFFHVKASEAEILGVLILLVILSEMINSSIEEMTDLITREHREEAKIAKDVAAGMVFVAAIGAAIIGVIIFVPYILRLFY